MAEGLAKAVDGLVYVGVGVFIFVLLMSLTYQSTAQSYNQIVTQYGSSAGITSNFSKYASPLPNVYGGGLSLAVYALVFIAVIGAVIWAVRGFAGNSSGGILGG